MSPRWLARRRPSAALVISFLALFVALGGAGWAALRVPPDSVGTAQLQNFSVGNLKLKSNAVGPRKIIPGSIGAVQVNPAQVQVRVAGPCSIGAIQSISVSGDVTCTPALPREYGSSGSASAVDSSATSPTQITTESLPGSQGGATYLVVGNVQLGAVDGASGTAQTVTVQCTLGGVGSAGTSQKVTLNLGGAYSVDGSATIPLVLPMSVSGNPQTAQISCYENSSPGPAAPVTATGTINAIQTAGND